MYCRKCGSKIKDSAQFCDHCGAEVVLVKQKSYSEKYNEKKQSDKQMKQNISKKDAQRREKHKDVKNPYVASCLFAGITSLVLAIFPWNLIGEGIGTSLPMRIAIVVFALLGDYHGTKAKQTNNYIMHKYGFEIQPNAARLGNIISVFATIMGLFALFTYGA